MDVFKTIFEAEPQFQRLLATLDEVNKKYGQSTAEINKQEAEMQALLVQEKKLLDARSKAQNPNQAVKLNKELDLTKKKIAELNAQLRLTAQANQTVDKTAKTAGDRMGKAFAVASINAAKKEIQAINTQTRILNTNVSSVSSGAKEFLSSLKNQNGVIAIKDFNGIFHDLDGNIIASYSNLRKLKNQAAQSFGTAEGEKYVEMVGHIEKKLKLAHEGMIAFTSENKFKTVGLLTEEIAVNIARFDFEGASEKSKLLSTLVSKITFKEALISVKQLGESLFNVGKALLVNPLFLLGTIIFAAVESFEALEKSAERTVEVMEALFEAERKVRDETLALSRVNRQLAREIEVNAQREYKVNGERQKARDKFIQEYLDAIRHKNDEEDKLNKEADKARDEDGFKATKRLYEFLGGETELTKQQKEGLLKIQLAHNEHMKELERNLHLETLKATEEEIKAQKDKIIELNKAIAEAAANNKSFDIEFKLKPLSQQQIKAGFDLQRQEVERNRAEELRLANLQFADEFKKKEILAKINKEFNLQQVLINKQEKLKQIEAAKEAGEIEIKIRKDVADKNNELLLNDLNSVKDLEEKRLAILSAVTVDESLVESQKATIKLSINAKYYEELAKITDKDFNRQIDIASDEIELLKKTIAEKKLAKFDTTKDEQELNEKLRAFDVLLSKSTIEQLKIRTDAERAAAEDEREINDALFNEIKAFNEELTRDEETQLTLRNASQSRHTLARVHDLQRKLDTLSLLERENTKEYRDLLAEKKKADQQYVKEVIQEYVDAYATISQAAFDAIKQVLQQQLDSLNKQTELQEKRVEDAKAIADKGNAEQLEEEEKRLDDLNKKREKFVRQQQALATAELISNTAIAVSKAAAQTGVGAAAGVAAALLALVAGLASARAIASQAAYYKGGEFEGYTGDGNPTQESMAVGRKPYVYHKREFIFNHQKTDENLDIFRRIHRGQVNLRDWENKVKMYDLNKARFNVAADTTMNPVILQQNGDIRALEGKLDGVIKAIQDQPGMKIALTREGVYGFVTAYEARQDLIKELAGGK